jgi:N-acetylneuraminic acid mutarotase
MQKHCLLPCSLCVALLGFAIISLPAQAQTTAPNEWTWMGGSSAGAEAPVIGTLGTPAVGNIPAARYQAVAWTDKSGNFWLFGGEIDYGSNSELFNDLWEFSPTTNEWGWMAGSTAYNTPGVYGTMGTPSPQNVPGGREDASGWTDREGNLWLFGGYGLDRSGAWGVLNDLWEFRPSTGEWTWMSGSNTIGSCAFNGWGCAQPSIYGTLGTPAPGNTPGSRDAAITWTDNKGNLWLFGGWGYDVSAQVQYYFDELWEYNISSKEWAWMGGSSTRDGSVCILDLNWNYYRCGEPGVYGTEGSPAAGNVPGGRAGAAGWTDSQGNLWLFSGNGFDINGYFGDPNDIWEFNPSSGQWTWVGGNSAITSYGCDYYDCSGPSLYGPLGDPTAGDMPLGRDHAVAWTDSSGKFWLFGGGGNDEPNDAAILIYLLNDLWVFNPSTNQWTLMGGKFPTICGDNCAQTPGAVYGALGVPAPGNNPGSRFAPAGWTDSNSNFWLFGGIATDPAGFYNDLWEYQPSSIGALPTTTTPTFSVPTGSYTSAQSVTINDATNGSFVYYTTDGTTPTIRSTYYNPSFSPPISVQHSETLRAIAVADGCYTSAEATATYTLPPPAATPTFSVPSGTYTSFQTVSLSDATPGATIYYTIDGTTPTTGSNVYNGPIGIVTTVTLQAVATAGGYSISNVGSATYMLNLPTAAMPTFSVADGTYNSPQTVTISDSTPGAVIYYQINGYASTGSPVYSGPITVLTSETIRAMATAKNYFPSGMAGATYDIDPLAPQTASPAFSVPSGTYSAPQTVTISDATSLAAIYFTTDGSTPTTGSSLYSGPITVSSSETLLAIATASGDTVSAVASATYTINLPTPDFSVTASPSSLTVTGGQTGTTTVSVMPSNGFTSVASFSCSGLPAGASCSFSPATVTPSGAAASTTLTVSTTAADAVLHLNSRPFLPAAALAALLCCFGWKKRRRLHMYLLLPIAFAGLGLITACGGGGGSGSGGGGGGGSQSATYTITVSATSGLLSHSTTFSLTVN